MAYSRWIRSRFYTYWLWSAETDVPFRNDQTLMIDDGEFKSVTYGDLVTKGVDAFLDSYSACSSRGLTTEEREELRGYIMSFMEDILDWNPIGNVKAKRLSNGYSATCNSCKSNFLFTLSDLRYAKDSFAGRGPNHASLECSVCQNLVKYSHIASEEQFLAVAVEG